MTGELLLALVAFAFVTSATPGPNNLMLMSSGANFGFRRTVPQMLGITFGFGSMALATGLGLAGVVHAEPRLHAVLKYAGAAYLLYLAWRIARADAASASAHQPIGFIEATLFTWTNPKAWVSVLGAAAAFTTMGGDLLAESALIAAILAVFCLLSTAVWAGFGTVIGRCLANPRARHAFNLSMAGLLVLSLIPVFW